MDLDTNQLCPGGTGKKIRFCCKDLTRELDKIVRLSEGGQRKAALEAIQQTLASAGDRACLHALKVGVLAESGDQEGVKTAMTEFAQKFPENPAALADGAMAAVQEGRTAEAVDLLQTAIERSGDSVDSRVYGALGIVAQGLLLAGIVPAARAHLLLQAELSRGRDPRPLQMLYQIDHAPQAPVILKFSMEVEDEIPGVPANELNEAVDKARLGEWRRALAGMKTLAESHPNQPALRKNVALLTSRLGDQEATARAWRDYASLPDVPWDDRVEAEAIAQMLSPTEGEEEVEELKVVYGVQDVDRLTERLLSDPRVVRYEGDLRELVEENETPPKLACSLLDRPEKPAEGETLTADTVPNVLGEVYLYGKRTDRDARLEFEVTRDEQYEKARQTLAEVAGEGLGDVQEEEVAEKISRMAHTLSWRWRFPTDTPLEQRRELMNQKRRQLIYERWPELPRAVFGGQTARQAASQEQYRVQVAAALLLMEAAGEQMRWELDFNPLCESLGLPVPGEIDPSGVNILALPLVRFARLPVERLSDDDLAAAFHRAAAFNHAPVLERIGREVLRRDSLGDKIDKAVVHRTLSAVTSDPKEAIEHLHQCRELVVRRGESPALLLLEEFRLRLMTGEGVEQCNRLLDQLRTNHFNEPGVQQAIFETLVEFGMITPDGRPTAAMRPKGSAAAETTATAAPATGKLWSGEAPAPAPAGEKKSKLWTPDFE